MKLAEKLPYARQHIDSIARHDDADIQEVEQSLGALKTYIDEELEAAKLRRAAKEKGDK